MASQHQRSEESSPEFLEQRWKAALNGLVITGREAQLHSVMAIPPKPPQLELTVRCPACGDWARRERLETWTSAAGWLAVERLVCLAPGKRVAGAGKKSAWSQACRNITVLSQVRIERAPPMVGGRCLRVAGPPHPTTWEDDVDHMQHLAEEEHTEMVEEDETEVTRTASAGASGASAAPIAHTRLAGDQDGPGGVAELTPTVKAEAIRLVLDEGKSCTQAGELLGVNFRRFIPIITMERTLRNGRLKSTRQPGAVAVDMVGPHNVPSTGVSTEPTPGQVCLNESVRRLAQLDIATYLSLPEDVQCSIRHLVATLGGRQRL